jgi:Replication initiator protein A
MKNSITPPEILEIGEELIQEFIGRNEGGGDSPSQPDLFVISDTVSHWPVKDDMSSMEFPIFALTKNKDTSIRTYSRGGKTLIPSVMGAANVFDKDILIYAISQLVKHREQGVQISRRIKINCTAFLKGTKRSTGGAAYKRILDTCRRLKGTTLETNIKTNEEEATKGFSLLDDYDVIQYTKNNDGALEMEITISEWLYRAVEGMDVLTINPDYFGLQQPLERRLYEIARKHCGDKAYWTVSLDILREKSGSKQPIKYFARAVRETVKDNNIPDYQLVIDDSGPNLQVVFFSKNAKKVFEELKKNDKTSWYFQLMKKNMQGKLV